MKLSGREGNGIVPVPSLVEDEVMREFKLELVGRTDEVREQIYLISLERRLKNPLLVRICNEAQRDLFRAPPK